MKTLFHLSIIVLLSVTLWSLTGCAGKTAAPGEVVETPVAVAPSTYELDTCARFTVAVAGQTLPCHYGDVVRAFSCDVVEGAMVRGDGTCGVVPDSTERGAWMCMRVTCSKEVGR